MKKYCKALVNITIALAILLLVIFLVPRALIFFSPFVVGAVVAMLARPLVRFFEEKIKLKRKAGSAFVIIAVIGLVILLLYLIGSMLVEQVLGLLNELPIMWASLEADLAQIAGNFDVIYQKLPMDVKTGIADMGEQIGSYLGEAIGGISAPTISAVGNFAKQLPSVIIGVIMALLSAYFFVADRDTVTDWLRKYLPASIQSRFLLMKRSLVKAVGGYLKAQLKIEVWMYLLLVIGLSILQVDYVLLIALVIAFLDFFPFFGTGTVMVPWAIIKILSADYKMAIGLLIIWGVGQLARQLIQPKIVGDSVGVPPIPTLFLLYIGYKLSGVIGMIAAVPIGLIIYTMYEEGAFDTTKNSILVLVAGINKFRHLEKEDLKGVEEMQEQERRITQELSQKTE
ncbi:MAG: sporulation integral membrane protein YtvI [Lachnospiraceae bacterium]|nr:sporulation integral membrane protein YtvI [Lachnospiraceae bacterium]